MEIQVHVGSVTEVSERTLESAVRHTLATDRRPAELSLTLVDDEQITSLNQEYLGKDGPTDVIAFSLGTSEEPLGDVYVGVDQARRQAQALGVATREELVRLTIHGTLHVLGHDHPEGEERAECPMYRLQERILSEVMEDAE